MSSIDSYQFNVNLNTFKGPLDVLLDLAKSQKVNLENISVTKLADQFHEFITKAKKINLELASEYLLMATWLTYLKSKLLLPESADEEFRTLEVAEQLKLQLKKLELIRLLSDQMLKRKRLGKDVFMKGIRGNIRSIYSSKYTLTLYELLKSYSTIIMTKDFQRINIPKLPVFTSEVAIFVIKKFFGKLVKWKNIDELIPKNFKTSKILKRAGKAGIFAGSLELAKEGNITIKQDKYFDNIYIRENK
jgi:segregation and condensation protein A